MLSLLTKSTKGKSFEEFVGNISMRLLRADVSAAQLSMQAILRDIGVRYDVDRVHWRWLPTDEFAGEDSELEMAAGWQRSGRGPGKVFTAHEVPWFLERLRSEGIYFLDDVKDLPAEAERDRQAVQSRGIQSLFLLRLAIDKDMVGAFSLSTTRPFHWSETVRSEVKSLAEILTNYYWGVNNRQKLRDSEARHRSVVQDMSDLILRWTPDGKTTWANDQWCEYLGQSRDQIIGSRDLVFMSEDDLRDLNEKILTLTPASPTLFYNYKWVKPSGELAWSEWTERGIFDAEGKLIEIQSVGRDITDRKLAHDALARKAAFQSRLAEVSSALLNVTAGNTNEIIADIQAIIGFDYSLDRVDVTWHENALPGFGKTMTWSPDGSAPQAPKPENFPRAYQLIQQGEIVKFDTLDELPEAARVDRVQYEKFGVVSLLSVPLRIKETVFGAATFVDHQRRHWDANTVSELQLLAHTITNAAVRQWSAVQIARREKDLARSQAVAKVGSYRLQATRNDDESENLLNVLNLTMSDQALEIFGIEPQSDPRAQLMAALEQIHPDDRTRVRELWRNTLQAGTEHTIEYRIVRPDGTLAHVQAREQFDGIDDDGVITFFGTYKDITQWVESNRELKVALSEIEKLKDQLQEENVLLKDEVRAAHGFDSIVGESAGLRQVLASAAQVAPTDVAVLICGETGTGKELIARSIHDLSPRKDKPMVSVNCAALSAELIESELFGHEKGAFTGAQDRRKGRFELADGGTLFLDEIGEMSGELQAKLLRVIQEGEFERLGGTRTLKADVRLIAATNRDLHDAMDTGAFRADLYYRISSFPIDLPPLRDRKEDIPLLAEHLVRKHAKILGKDVQAISARMLRYLQAQDWPGNIRELEGLILRALVSNTGATLDYVAESGERSGELPEPQPGTTNFVEAQRSYIVEILNRVNWVIEGDKGAARALGLAPSSLRSKMKRLDIVRPD
jgi:PAS domain S-box-containing protein